MWALDDMIYTMHVILYMVLFHIYVGVQITTVGSTEKKKNNLQMLASSLIHAFGFWKIINSYDREIVWA